MAEYRKQIAYLDYLEDGVKIKNAGFVRIEEQNGHSRMEVKVKNLPGKDSGEFRLQEEHERTIGRISLQGGNGNCCMVWRIPEPDETDDSREESWQQTAQLRILLSGTRMLTANWHEPVEIPAQTGRPVQLPQGREQQSQPSQAQGLPTSQSRQESFQPQPQERSQRLQSQLSPTSPHGAGEIIPYPESHHAVTEQPAVMEQPSAAPEEPAVMKQRSAALEESAGIKQPSAASKEAAVTEQSAVQEQPTVTEQPAASKEPSASTSTSSLPTPSTAPKSPSSPSREPVCSADKWEQLCTMYPEIHPFRDSREYLSIAPKDFVVLCKEYQKLVHNSFLLHGYYNYRHLILGRIRQKDTWQYYIGVPGNFYDREKMVAEMFGFEAFEGEKESASPGDYGYYMKRVEI